MSMFVFEEEEKGIPERWIQKAIKRRGRVREFVRNMFGEKAFDEKGRIKIEYLYKALEIAKALGDRSLYSAILLAIRLKKMGEKKNLKHQQSEMEEGTCCHRLSLAGISS